MFREQWAMTAATLVAMAVGGRGRLSWDATIAEILPEAMRRADAGWRAVTVAQLLEHRAGAPADAARLWTLFAGAAACMGNAGPEAER